MRCDNNTIDSPKNDLLTQLKNSLLNRKSVFAFLLSSEVILKQKVMDTALEGSFTVLKISETLLARCSGKRICVIAFTERDTRGILTM